MLGQHFESKGTLELKYENLIGTPAPTKISLSEEESNLKPLLDEFLLKIKVSRERASSVLPKGLKSIITPKVFISYAWEEQGTSKNNILQGILTNLYNDLKKAGLDGWLDVKDLETRPINTQMEEQIDQSQCALLIGTNLYAQKTTSLSQTNVRKEYELIKAKHQYDKNFIVLPILFEGERKQVFPELSDLYIPDCSSWFSLKIPHWVSFEKYLKDLVRLTPFGILPHLLGLNRNLDYHKACKGMYERHYQSLEEQIFKIQSVEEIFLSACKNGDYKTILGILWGIRGSSLNPRSFQIPKEFLSAAIWSLNSKLVKLLRRFGTAPLSIEECHSLNTTRYGSFFVVNNFNPLTSFIGWNMLVKEMDQSMFIRNVHLKILQEFWLFCSRNPLTYRHFFGDEATNWESLKNHAQEMAGKNMGATLRDYYAPPWALTQKRITQFQTEIKNSMGWPIYSSSGQWNPFPSFPSTAPTFSSAPVTSLSFVPQAQIQVPTLPRFQLTNDYPLVSLPPSSVPIYPLNQTSLSAPGSFSNSVQTGVLHFPPIFTGNSSITSTMTQSSSTMPQAQTQGQLLPGVIPTNQHRLFPLSHSLAPVPFLPQTSLSIPVSSSTSVGQTGDLPIPPISIFTGSSSISSTVTQSTSTISSGLF